ncbi:ankyrin repeat domain-containing protein 2A-like [Impatiens glandulifera]|uniref:ankyrin repeat domain-containing protein 2A-like n=1 Tax=Impatiens glandulifera TaxID=253017 RepID=UPI001FB17ACA|nr:ankyrin repeat domain-containing protein 2A-like [Impatiens glandulifera]
MSILERQNYLFINYNSGDESSNSTSDDSSSSDEEDSIFLGDVDEFMAEVESKIHPHFREIAASIKKDDVFGLSVALDNFIGNIDEDLIDGETALHYACENYSRSCFELLLQRNANIEATNTRGSIPLHKACPLHEAATYGNARVVKLLLECGACTDITNYDGKIPWDLAKPNSNIRRILEENDED